MTTPPVRVAELAARFWAAAGPPPAFPRDLEAVVTDALPLGVVTRRGLCVATVAEFVRRDRLPAPAGPDRPLRGALWCWGGSGYLFLDADDPPDERRFSLAHEIAHYLGDYAAPRRRALAALGAASLEVLDGLRPATDAERVGGVLRGCPLGPHAHLMSRDPAGRPAGDGERSAEARADRLAYELLAPAALLHADGDQTILAARLVGEFGLPAAAAREYAEVLRPREASAGAGVARWVNSVRAASNSLPAGGTDQ